MSIYKFLVPLIFFYLMIGVTEASSRIAFSRPGNMMRIPNVDNSMYRNLLTLDLSSEILSAEQYGFACIILLTLIGLQSTYTPNSM